MRATDKALSAERNQKLLEHDRGYLARGFRSLAGVDEVGRGPLAGPVVASAVIVKDPSFSTPIDDSKKLTHRLREAAFEEIRAKCLVAVAVIDRETIDRVNILAASMLAMSKALGDLSEAPECVLVDGLHVPEGPGYKFPVVAADSKSLAVACASIVAKVTRDRMMDELDLKYPGYGFAKHKGYGTAAHLEAVKQLGPCEIHRRTFEPIKSWLVASGS